MAQKGRPRLFENKPVKKNFDLSQELVAELLLAAKKRKQPVVEIVRTAIEKELGLTDEPTSVLKKVPSTQQSEIKAALLEALDEHKSADPNTHRVKLSPDLNEKLEIVTKGLGYPNSGQVIEEILRFLLRDPSELREIIMSKTLLDIEKAFGMTQDPKEKPKRLRKAE